MAKTIKKTDLIESWKLECTINGHNKFYNIDLYKTGSNWSANADYGRINLKGKTRVIDTWYSESIARVAIKELMESKIKKGYVLKSSTVHSINTDTSDLSSSSVEKGTQRFLRLFQ